MKTILTILIAIGSCLPSFAQYKHWNIETKQYDQYNSYEDYVIENAENCENIIDTLKSKLKFIDSLDHYQYKIINEKKREYEFIRDVQLYSLCLYGMDTSTVNEIFGIPSVIKNKTEWEYHTSDYHYRDQYAGDGMRLHFSEKGTLSYIDYIWTKAIISPSHCY